MSEYQSFHCTALGYSHVKKGTACQDFSGSFDADGVHIAVVSDGHGQKTSFRSDVGSRMAVETAMEMLKSLAEFLQGQEDLLFRQEEQQSLFRKLADKVVRGWNSRVRQHLQENPLTEEEYALAGDMAEHFRTGRNLPHIYGATLIAALLTERYLLVMHQGDGRCVVIHENGRADQPVPWDPRCVGNVCTSLCHPDAVESCRFYVLDLRKDAVAACYVTTDGVEDCFPDQAGLNAFFCELTSQFAREGKFIERSLAERLPLMSQYGSMDDVSIAAVAAPTAAVKLADRLKLVSYFHSFRLELHSAKEKLNSMERKLEHLKDQYRSAVTDYERRRAEAAGMGMGVTPELIRAEKAVQDARRDYDTYVERFNSFRAQAKTAKKKTIRVLEVMRLLECEELLAVDETEMEYILQKIRKKVSPTRQGIAGQPPRDAI